MTVLALDSFLSFAFNIIFFSILAFILYSFFVSCTGARQPSIDDHYRGGPGGGFNGGPGGLGGGNNPPPPYDPSSKQPPANIAPSSGLGGFWTGVGLGGAGAAGAAYLANQWRERERYYREQQPGYGGIGRSNRWDQDRGEGTSRWGNQGGRGGGGGGGGGMGLGEVRTTSGFGGSSVR